MRTNLKKIIASSLAVVTVAGALAATSGAASEDQPTHQTSRDSAMPCAAAMAMRTPV